MGLLSLTADGASFLLDESDITVVYAVNSVTYLEYKKKESNTLETIVVAETLAVIDALSDDLIELTKDGVVFLLNKKLILSVVAETGGSKIVFADVAKQDVSVSETPTEINYLIETPSTEPLRYKVLLSQNAPITTQTSGVFLIGQIWSITDYVGGIASGKDSVVGGTGYTTANGVATTGGSGTGLTVDIIDTAGVITTLAIANGGENYEVGDVITVTGGNANATFVVSGISGDDFSNMELISGTMNTTGAMIRATVTTPTVWSNGSDLAYDGSPYVVSTDVNGDLNPFINTIGNIVWSYSSAGTFLATLTSAFLDTKVSPTLNNFPTNGSARILRISNNQVRVITYDSLYAEADDILLRSTVEIEVYP